MKKRLIILFIILLTAGGILFLFPKTKEWINIDTAPTVIGVLPFASIEKEQVDSVKNTIEKMYGFEVVVLENVDMPEMAYTTIRYPRYRADSLLFWLSDIYSKPDSVDIIIGLTNKDISITKYKEGTKEIKDPEWMYKDFGIFGLGRINGTACVVSSNRLHKGVSDAKFNSRLTRIASHEIGHVLGLRHCPEPNCLMNDANESILTIDNSTGDLCKKCWSKIH